MNKLENPKNAVIDLGYFNIFVPKQNPVNPYAMVLPVFCKAFLEGWEITINRDGETRRDFTFVENAVLLNVGCNGRRIVTTESHYSKRFPLLSSTIKYNFIKNNKFNYSYFQ
jgi:nucleoside-diphosphate-sugar epimerase